MNDVSKQFGTTGSAPAVDTYSHPLKATILEECESLLQEIPEGRRLLSLAKERGYKVDVIAGREPDFRYVAADTTYLICPHNTKAVDLEVMALIYALAIYELEQPSLGIHRQTSLEASQKHILFKQLLDITLKMCHIVGEFEDREKPTKLVDYVSKLGHSELYRGFRLGKSKEELTKIYSVIVKAV